MGRSINVTDVVNVYYSISKAWWKREERRVRGCDALVFFTEGEIMYFFEGKTLVAKAGDLLILPGNLPYSGKSLGDKSEYFVLNFNCSERDSFERLGAPAVIGAKEPARTRALFEEILSCWQRQQIDAELRVKGFLYSQLADFFSAEATETVGRGATDVLAYVREHFCDPTLNLSSLCAHFFVSESQLRRNIKKETGFSPNEYITVLRINKAKNHLMQGNASIKEIALECGFESPYYFSRCFSKHVGISPREFRDVFKST